MPGASSASHAATESSSRLSAPANNSSRYSGSSLEMGIITAAGTDGSSVKSKNVPLPGSFISLMHGVLGSGALVPGERNGIPGPQHTARPTQKENALKMVVANEAEYTANDFWKLYDELIKKGHSKQVVTEAAGYGWPAPFLAAARSRGRTPSIERYKQLVQWAAKGPDVKLEASPSTKKAIEKKLKDAIGTRPAPKKKPKDDAFTDAALRAKRRLADKPVKQERDMSSYHERKKAAWREVAPSVKWLREAFHLNNKEMGQLFGWNPNGASASFRDASSQGAVMPTRTAEFFDNVEKEYGFDVLQMLEHGIEPTRKAKEELQRHLTQAAKPQPKPEPKRSDLPLDQRIALFEADWRALVDEAQELRNGGTKVNLRALQAGLKDAEEYLRLGLDDYFGEGTQKEPGTIHLSGEPQRKA